jgi:hypothetical protein
MYKVSQQQLRASQSEAPTYNAYGKKEVKLSLQKAVVEDHMVVRLRDNRFTVCGKVVSLTRRPAALYTPGKFLVLISVRG